VDQDPPMGMPHTPIPHAYLRWAMPLITALLLASLAVNAITIWTLLRARSIARDSIGTLAAQLEDAGNDTLRLDIPINQSIPINTTVPISRQLTVPISTTIPFDDVIKIPILGSSVDIPFQAEIPVRVEVPVTIDVTVPISTSVAVNMSVPLELSVAETPIAGYLQQLRQSLLEMRERL
jgi:hypothetical protein